MQETLYTHILNHSLIMRGRLSQERMTDGLCFRTSQGQRQFLEQYAEEQKISLCEAARRVLEAGIKSMT